MKIIFLVNNKGNYILDLDNFKEFVDKKKHLKENTYIIIDENKDKSSGNAFLLYRYNSYTYNTLVLTKTPHSIDQATDYNLYELPTKNSKGKKLIDIDMETSFEIVYFLNSKLQILDDSIESFDDHTDLNKNGELKEECKNFTHKKEDVKKISSCNQKMFCNFNHKFTTFYNNNQCKETELYKLYKKALLKTPKENCENKTKEDCQSIDSLLEGCYLGGIRGNTCKYDTEKAIKKLDGDLKNLLNKLRKNPNHSNLNDSEKQLFDYIKDEKDFEKIITDIESASNKQIIHQLETIKKNYTEADNVPPNLHQLLCLRNKKVR